jgi:hypothetical protein
MILLAVVAFAVVAAAACRCLHSDEPGECPPYEMVQSGPYELRYALEECDTELGVVCCRVGDMCEC